jgi:hypothetical protein
MAILRMFAAMKADETNWLRTRYAVIDVRDFGDELFLIYRAEVSLTKSEMKKDIKENKEIILTKLRQFKAVPDKVLDGFQYESDAVLFYTEMDLLKLNGKTAGQYAFLDIS